MVAQFIIWTLCAFTGGSGLMLAVWAVFDREDLGLWVALAVGAGVISAAFIATVMTINLHVGGKLWG